MKALDLDNVQEAKTYNKLPPGGYICKIKSVEDHPDREFLKIEYDIAEGEFKQYYQGLFNSKGFWGGTFIKSYKQAALPFFKSFVNAITGSNSSFKWDGETESQFVGKLVGLVLAEEERLDKNGQTRIYLYVDEIRTTKAIKEGKFNKKPIKKLQRGSKAAMGDSDLLPVADGLDDKDLPF